MDTQYPNIQIGFDMQPYGVQQQPIKPRIIKHMPKPKQKYYEEFPADYLEQLELPNLNIDDGEPKYRIIYQQIKEPQPILQNVHVKHIRQKGLKQQQQIDQSGYTSNSQSISQSVQDVSIIQKQQRKHQHSHPKSIQPSQRTIKSVQLVSKINWIKKTRILKINLLFLSMYLRTLKHFTKEKQQQQESFVKEHFHTFVTDLNELVQEKIEGSLLELINLKDDLQFQLGQDKNNDKKKLFIQKFLMKIFGSLGKDLKPEILIKSTGATLLNQLIQSKKFPIKKYFLKFEAVRIPLTKYGAIIGITSEQQKMVLLVFMIIRIMLFQFIYRAWQFHPNQQGNDQLFLIQRNSIIIASIVHEIVIQWIEKNVKVVRPVHLDFLKEMLDYLELPLSDDIQNLLKLEKRFNLNVLIEGVMAPIIIQKYILSRNGAREEWVDKLEIEIMKIIDQLQAYLNKQEQDEIKLIKKQRVIQLMFKFDQQMKQERRAKRLGR